MARKLKKSKVSLMSVTIRPGFATLPFAEMVLEWTFLHFLQREPTNRQLFLQDIERDDVPKVITKLLQGFI